jgi:hypothetical protein
MESAFGRISATMMQHARFHLPFLLAVLVLAACDDRLPTGWGGPETPHDTTSNNSFLIDGNGYRMKLYDFGEGTAVAYYFSADSVTSVWNTGAFRDSSGRRQAVAVHISFPGASSGVYAWDDAFLHPASQRRVRITIDTAEYLSVSGLTQAFVLVDASRQTISGQYAGVLRNRYGGYVTVSDGRFKGAYF